MAMDSPHDALTCLNAGFPIRTSPTRHGHTPLVGAFRSVSRPSSASCTQASPVCSCSLLTFPGSTETLIPVLLRKLFAVRLALPDGKVELAATTLADSFRCDVSSLDTRNIMRVVLSQAMCFDSSGSCFSSVRPCSFQSDVPLKTQAES
jgi:hypothetical protein